MKKIELRIRTFGDPVLTKAAKQIRGITGYHRKLLSEMSRLMYEVSGVGLAAPQIGVSESLIVVDAGSGLYKLINPKIVKREGAQAIEEGCLSVPGISVKVKRAKKLILEALDEDGEKLTIEAEDLLACVFQHELDHLNGKLIIDYSPNKEEIKKKIKGLKKIG